MPEQKSRFAILLLAIYLCEFLLLGIAPYDRTTWWAENIPIVGIVIVLVISHRWFRFSHAAYLAMSVLIFLHTIGGHYTFERVPFGWITETFGFERNHFDRIAHFSVGFYAFPLAELLERGRMVRSRVIVFLFPVFAIFTVAALYEIIEWLYAATAGGAAGAAFLGSQGDPWDAQKDMLADGLGAIVAAGAYLLLRRPIPDHG